MEFVTTSELAVIHTNVIVKVAWVPQSILIHVEQG